MFMQTELRRMNQLSAVKTNISAQLLDKSDVPAHRSWEEHHILRKILSGVLF